MNQLVELVHQFQLAVYFLMIPQIQDLGAAEQVFDVEARDTELGAHAWLPVCCSCWEMTDGPFVYVSRHRYFSHSMRGFRDAATG